MHFPFLPASCVLWLEFFTRRVKFKSYVLKLDFPAARAWGVTTVLPSHRIDRRGSHLVPAVYFLQLFGLSGSHGLHPDL